MEGDEYEEALVIPVLGIGIHNIYVLHRPGGSNVVRRNIRMDILRPVGYDDRLLCDSSSRQVDEEGVNQCMALAKA